MTNHLTILKQAGIVNSEKKKSTKGPEREYFKLNQAVILSLTVAPNLFLATLRNLEENKSNQFTTITPELQLGSSKKTSFNDVMEEGLNLLPQIKEGLLLLESQQSKLLRGYQGLRHHIQETLEKNDFTSPEIRILLLLIEQDGEMSQAELSLALNLSPNSIPELINPLIQKNIVVSEYFNDELGNISFKVKLKLT